MAAVAIRHEVVLGIADRRKDHERRKRVARMTRAELQRELLTDHLTGLPNARAFRERVRPEHVAILDVDGLKWCNDELGYEAGDQLLRAVATALIDCGVEAYHVHGDEFYVVTDSQDVLAHVHRRLARVAFSLRDLQDRARVFQGATFSWGIGSSLALAEEAMKRHKRHREALGLRPRRRGDRPPGLRELNQDLCPLTMPWVKPVLVN